MLTLRLCGFLFLFLPCCHYGLGLCLSSGLLFRLGLCAFRLIFFSLLLGCLQAVPLCNRVTNIICAQKDFFHVPRIGAVHLVQNGQSLIHLLNHLQNILLYGLHGRGCVCVLRFENPFERKIFFYVMDIVIIKFPYLRCLFFPLATLIIFHLGVNVVDGPLDNGHQFLLFLFKLLIRHHDLFLKFFALRLHRVHKLVQFGAVRLGCLDGIIRVYRHCILLRGHSDFIFQFLKIPLYFLYKSVILRIIYSKFHIFFLYRRENQIWPAS